MTGRGEREINNAYYNCHFVALVHALRLGQKLGSVVSQSEHHTHRTHPNTNQHCPLYRSWLALMPAIHPLTIIYQSSWLPVWMRRLAFDIIWNKKKHVPLNTLHTADPNLFFGCSAIEQPILYKFYFSVQSLHTNHISKGIPFAFRLIIYQKPLIPSLIFSGFPVSS